MVSQRIRANYGGGDSAGDPVRYFRNLVTKVDDGVGAELQQAMDDGRDTMKHLIKTRGTSKSGKAGRHESWHMVNSVSSNVYPGTKAGNQVGRFGWIEEYENYFGFQEGGFDHVNGVTVEGMYAMVDAADIVFKEFEDNVEKVMRNA